MPVGAAAPVTDDPALPSVVQKSVAFLCKAFVQPRKEKCRCACFRARHCSMCGEHRLERVTILFPHRKCLHDTTCDG